MIEARAVERLLRRSGGIGRRASLRGWSAYKRVQVQVLSPAVVMASCLLGAGPLSHACRRPGTPLADQCRVWLDGLIARGVVVVIASPFALM